MNGNIDQQIRIYFKKDFEILCQKILVSAYKDVLANKNYDTEWKENEFTTHLIGFMRKQKEVKKNKMFIKREIREDDNSIRGKNSDPDKDPVIDIWLANWLCYTPNEYFIEAKILSEKDWEKKSGKVKSSKQRGRYIDTGINNFISGKYPLGCLCGYIVQGNTQKIAEQINRLLTRRKRGKERLIRKNLVSMFDDSYISIHNIDRDNSIELKHFFLKFYKK